MPPILNLFVTFFQIGLFSFGGGYAALPLIQQIAVESNHWITMQQMNDMVAISQMTPGPIGINAATFIGYQVCGLSGSVSATLGYVLPSIFLVGLLVALMNRFKSMAVFDTILSWLRPAVIGLIAASGISILLSVFRMPQLPVSGMTVLALVLVFSFVLLRRKKSSPILVMLLGGGISAVYGLLLPLFG